MLHLDLVALLLLTSAYPLGPEVTRKNHSAADEDGLDREEQTSGVFA